MTGFLSDGPKHSSLVVCGGISVLEFAYRIEWCSSVLDKLPRREGTVHLVRQYPNALPICRKAMEKAFRDAVSALVASPASKSSGQPVTKLTREHPAHVVCARLGYSERVARSIICG